MMNRVVLDTSLVIAYIQDDDAHHKEAVETITSLKSEISVLLPGAVLLELVLIVKMFPKLEKPLKDFISAVDEIVEVDEFYFDELVSFVRSSQLRLKPNDYSILHVADSRGATLLTFDKKLEVAYLELSAQND